MSFKKDVPIGIQNHGNTCFVNATFQSLANCDHLYEAFQSEYLRVHQLAAAQHHPTPTMGCVQSLTKPCLLCLLEKAMIMIRSPQNPSSASYIVKSVIDAFPLFPMNLFTKGRQEDCHEFIVNILFAFQLQLEDLTLTDSVILPSPSTPSSSFTPLNNDHYVHHPSLESLFQGSIQQKIQCQKCMNSSIREESMIDLAVDIQSSSTLETSIQDYFQVVEFQGNNCYDCSVCQMKTEAKQSLQLTTFPKILCIQLKRFFLLGNELKKIKHFVSFPLEFYFPSSLSDDEYNQNNQSHDNNSTSNSNSNGNGNGKKGSKKRKFFQHLRKQAEKERGGEIEYYALKAIIVHRGETINNGHYVSYLRRNGNQWYLADDEKVSAVSVDEVLQAHAYILFYEKETSPYTVVNKIKPIEMFTKEVEVVLPVRVGRQSVDFSTTISSIPPAEHPPLMSSSGLLRTVSSKFNFFEKLNLWKSKIQEKERLGALRSLQSRQHQQQATSTASDGPNDTNVQHDAIKADVFDDVVDLTGFQDQVIFDSSPLPATNQFDNEVRLSILSPPPRKASLITEPVSTTSKSSISRESTPGQEIKEDEEIEAAPFSPHITQRRGGKRRRDTFNNELDKRLEEFEKKKQFDFISSPNYYNYSPLLLSPQASLTVQDDVKDITESPTKRQKIENDNNVFLNFPLTVVKGISKLFNFRKSKKDKENKRKAEEPRKEAEKDLISLDSKVVDLTMNDESSKDLPKDEGRGSFWEEGKKQVIKGIQSVLFDEELFSSPSKDQSTSQLSPSQRIWH